MEGKSFYQWLAQSKLKDTALGDLVRAVILDKDRPKAGQLAAWEYHLGQRGAPYAVLKLLREAWRAYEAGLRPEGTDQKASAWRNNDEHFTIARPALPNYWGDQQVSELLAVRNDPPSETETMAMHLDFRSAGHSHWPVTYVAGRMFMDAIEQFANYFRRELGYDFLSYTAKDHERRGDAVVQPYLFMDRDHCNRPDVRPIGFCVFYYVSELESWRLHAVWFHPYFRRKGHLSRVWPYFHWQYGNFWADTPLSSAMQAFLEKHHNQ